MKYKILIWCVCVPIICMIAGMKAYGEYQDYQYSKIPRQMTTIIDQVYVNWDSMQKNIAFYESQKELINHICGAEGQAFTECKYLSEEQLQKFDRFEKGELYAKKKL